MQKPTNSYSTSNDHKISSVPQDSKHCITSRQTRQKSEIFTAIRVKSERRRKKNHATCTMWSRTDKKGMPVITFDTISAFAHMRTFSSDLKSLPWLIRSVFDLMSIERKKHESVISRAAKLVTGKLGENIFKLKVYVFSRDVCSYFWNNYSTHGQACARLTFVNLVSLKPPNEHAINLSLPIRMKK